MQKQRSESGLTLSVHEGAEVAGEKQNGYLKTHIHLIEILKCMVDSDANETRAP